MELRQGSGTAAGIRGSSSEQRQRRDRRTGAAHGHIRVVHEGGRIVRGGSGVKGKPARHWRIASGSAKEADCHLRLLVHAGAVDRRRAETVLALFDQVRAMTWQLLHPRG